MKRLSLILLFFPIGAIYAAEFLVGETAAELLEKKASVEKAAQDFETAESALDVSRKQQAEKRIKQEQETALREFVSNVAAEEAAKKAAEEAAVVAFKKSRALEGAIMTGDPNVVQEIIANGAKPNILHIMAATHNIGETTPLIINYLLLAGAPVSQDSLLFSFLSAAPESEQVFAMLAEKEGVKHAPLMKQPIKIATRSLQWAQGHSHLTPQERALLAEKVDIYNSIKQRELSMRSSPALKGTKIYESDLPTPINVLPDEQLLPILEKSIQSNSLEEISRSTASISISNKRFARLLNDETLMKMLISEIAQEAPIKRFLEPLLIRFENPSSFLKDASYITAAAVLHTPTSIQLLTDYIQAGSKNRPNVAQMILAEAAITDNPVIVDSLLRTKTIDPNGGRQTSPPDLSKTPLASAIESQSLPSVILLLKAGADPNKKAALELPLSLAVQKSSADVVAALLDWKSTQPIKGSLLIQALRRNPDIDMIRTLLDKKPLEINMKDSGKTPLDVALYTQQQYGINPEIIDLLKQRGAKKATELPKGKS